ncbi:uncharacterized protein LOC143220743 [Lasioglossum baleicum]|uniref:uncharacterized protein LOC143220743 n=1 Tax=Lasioglossum baleicum TaxID=434251 RepID=UPI003FCCE629
MGATLLFDAELINISDAPPIANLFKEIDSDRGNQLSHIRRKKAKSVITNVTWLFVGAVELLPEEGSDRGGSGEHERERAGEEDMLVDHDKLVENKDKNAYISHDEL